ncbi:MAG: Glycosyl transferases group 1 [Methanocella sp. PtaU1.Bin125]|nr:MAG: Glycosyl transferases group 1 [Methanocella sp. PtaU1.Bin125]
MIKIAFQMMGGASWTFGPVYLKDLFNVLRRSDNERLKLFLLAPDGQESRDYAMSVSSDNNIFYNTRRYDSVKNRLERRFLSRDLMTEKLLIEEGVSVLFGPVIPYRYIKVATLSWIPDFQHVHLPDMFSDKEKTDRSKVFLRSAKNATRIVVLSNAVKDDFKSFAPEYVDKVRVFRPVSLVPPSIYDRDPGWITKKYDIPEKFFFLPNQFWKHKNHEIVFRAVRELSERRINVTVVCAGNIRDYRNPVHFDDLCRRLSEWKITDNVKIIGLVPKEDILTLIRQSICVINPSLFEGFGNTVEETRAVGKRLILSDIPPHHEQNPPKAFYFDAHDSGDLSEKMAVVWRESNPGPDLDLEKDAIRDLPGRVNAYLETFVSITKEALEEMEKK